MSRWSVILLTAPLLLAGQAASAEVGEPPERESTVIVFGDDPCPQISEDEIVICARRPESERYRIPRPLRDEGQRPSEISWASRVETLEDVARQMRPGGCSVVGSDGQTGCLAEMLRQWIAERRSK